MRLFRNIFDWGRIRNKFLLVSLAIGIIPLLALGAVSYIVSESSILNNSKRIYAGNLSIADGILNLLTKDVESRSRLVLSNQGIASIIQQHDREGEVRYLDVRTLRSLDSAIQQIFFDKPDLTGVFMFGIQNFRYQYAPFAVRQIPLESILFQELHERDWYVSTVLANGRECYFQYNVLEDYYDEPPLSDSFSTAKLLRDLSTGESYGMLVVNMRADYYKKIYPAALLASNSCYLLADAKSAAGDYVGLHMGEVEDLADALSFYPNGRSTNDRYIVSMSRNTRTGWDLIHLIERSELLASSSILPYATLAAIVIMLCLSAFFSIWAANTISKPLTRLNTAIEEMDAKGFTTVEHFGDGEVGAIGNRFKEMAQRNDQLNKRIIRLSLLEKEAELNALQAQINPHFLYNSLAAMYWLAKFDKCAEVAQMAESLSEIFKLALNKGRDMITVAEEINYIQKYIDIQNIRYNNRIQTTWEIDEGLMNQKILKLILQPLVENAIYHGLEPQLGEWRLLLGGCIENGAMLFTVSDNGVGMDVPSSLAHGFGINNVTDRIRMKYGGEYGCDFQSSIGEGTTVRVRIPYEDQSGGG